MVSGKLPFKSEDDIDDPMEFYNHCIKDKKFTYPQFQNNEMLKKLILQLLSSVPKKRLGGSY